MNILGIDPGSKKVGYAIIKISKNKTKVLVAGYIENKKDTFCEGLSYVSKEIKQLFINYKIDEVAIEDIFYSYSPKTVIKLAQYRGAICMSILEYKDTFFEYTALQVKKAVTGRGNSTKEQVSFIIRKIFNIKEEIKVLDITDAIAVALTHKQRI